MKLVALTSIRHGQLVSPAQSEVNPSTGTMRAVPAVTKRKMIEPGTTFDTKAIAMSDEDGQRLVDSGSARHIADEPQALVPPLPVAQTTAPRGPVSGATEAPDGDAVADQSKAAAARRSRAG